jgi:hypothetical protein
MALALAHEIPHGRDSGFFASLVGGCALIGDKMENPSVEGQAVLVRLMGRHTRLLDDGVKCRPRPLLVQPWSAFRGKARTD